LGHQWAQDVSCTGADGAGMGIVHGEGAEGACMFLVDLAAQSSHRLSGAWIRSTVPCPVGMPRSQSTPPLPADQCWVRQAKASKYVAGTFCASAFESLVCAWLGAPVSERMKCAVDYANAIGHAFGKITSDRPMKAWASCLRTTCGRSNKPSDGLYCGDDVLDRRFKRLYRESSMAKVVSVSGSADEKCR